MTGKTYARPPGGHPDQSELLTGRSVCSGHHVVIPRGTMRDIVASRLPHWDSTRLWMLARPLTGFSETFSHYVMEVQPGGGSDDPEPDAGAESVLFVTHGQCAVETGGISASLLPGGYAYVPAGNRWTLNAEGRRDCVFHWIRKRYEAAAGIRPPPPFFTNEADITPEQMPGSGNRWTTTRFVDPGDLRHDMHVNIVNFAPGAVIPFLETHVMEHGLYVLEGKGAYRLNQDWVEVEAGDYVWLRAFCPQACYAGGPGPFRYLLYKDVNRHARLWPQAVSKPSDRP